MTAASISAKPISYFNPCSNLNEINQSFTSLSLCQRITIIALTILVGAFTFGYGGMVLFRYLSHTWSQQTNGQMTDLVNKNKSKEVNLADAYTPPLKEIISLIKQAPSGSFIDELTTSLSEAYETASQNTVQLWQIGLFLLLKKTHIDDSYCYSRLTWANCHDFVLDARSVVLDTGQKFFVQDAINDQTHHVNMVSLKRQMLAFSDPELNDIRIHLDQAGQNQIENYDMQKFIQHLKNTASILQNKFAGQFTFIETYCMHTNPVRNYLMDLLKPIVIKKLESFGAHYIDQCQDPKCKEEIVQELVHQLLFTNKTLRINDTVLWLTSNLHTSFPKSPFVFHNEILEHITPYLAGPLNSLNYSDEPFIGKEPLELARYILTYHIRQAKDLPRNIKDMHDQWVRFIIKHYYDHLLAYAFKHAKRPEKKKPINSSASTPAYGPNKQVYANTGQGMHNIKFWRNRRFKKIKNWNITGNCFLGCFVPYNQLNPSESLQRVLDLRKQIANYIETHIDDYLPYVQLVPHFNTLKDEAKIAILKNCWVAAEGIPGSDLAKYDTNARKAIKDHCNALRTNQTFLHAVEYGVVSKLLKTAIYIYDKKATKFFVEGQQLVPHVIYGSEFKTITHLWDTGKNHYHRLEPIAR